jgi:hypothetical protein
MAAELVQLGLDGLVPVVVVGHGGRGTGAAGREVAAHQRDPSGF